MRPARATVVGSGPNGLAAAVLLARRGIRVQVLERNSLAGGGARTEPLTLPGFLHDTCSAVHPLASVSPVFRSLALHRHGLRWIAPPAELAHPLDDGSAALVSRSVKETAFRLGADARAYLRLFGPLRDPALITDILSPRSVPSRPRALAWFGWNALRSCSSLARAQFRAPPARALLAGICAHSCLPLDRAGSAATGLLLGAAAHIGGWPIPARGSGTITSSLVSMLERSGGRISFGSEVRSIGDIPPSDLLFLDTAPALAERLFGEILSERYRRSLSRFKYGAGIFKVDWALDAPIPWRAPECALAATVHLGGSLEEIEESERATNSGQCPSEPFVLLAQPSLFDPSRAPPGKHTAWAYCHVPHGSTFDMTERIEAQIERFAPGFRSRILARNTRDARATERENPNYVGGDITGGIPTLRQLLFRPVVSWDPYSIPPLHAYLCSASTPPGPGVHGMCGLHAVRSALDEPGLGPAEPLLDVEP